MTATVVLVLDVPDDALVRMSGVMDWSGQQAAAELTLRSKQSTDALRAETERLRVQLVSSGQNVETLTRRVLWLNVILVVLGIVAVAVAIGIAALS